MMGAMHVDRYAPSPTSDLHLGNLRTALAGWLLAKAAGGQWLMRVEDLDTARVRAAEGVEERQLADLSFPRQPESRPRGIAGGELELRRCA